MVDNPDSEPRGLEDEVEFEASLISDTNSTFIDEDTKIIEPFPIGDFEQPEDMTVTIKQPGWAGKKLGNFKLLRLIGEGKMGIVIQALDINLQRIVALKVLRKRIAGLDEQEGVQQFLREARAAARIEHPNVVQIYEINQHKGWWYIAMEMLEGETLQRVVKAGGALSSVRACPLIADAATALRVAHEIGIIHRDVKPSNLMITRTGRCKLTDFGLVRVDDPQNPFDFTDKSVGTPHFMAPEMIRRQKQTPAIDVYSLGCTLYFALTAQPPYTGEKLTEVLDQHLDAEPPDLRKVCPECPASLAAIIQQTMAKNPAERPSAGDLAAALRAETIGLFPDDSGIRTASGSSIMNYPFRPSADTTMIAGARPAGLKRLVKSGWFWLPTAAVLIFLGVLLWSILVKQTGEVDISGGFTNAELAEFFPKAPQTYGLLPANSTGPLVDFSKEPPPFSWVGKKDVTGIKFIASSKGHHFYPIDAPAAKLISADNFVGYQTEADAEADGKIPAP